MRGFVVVSDKKRSELMADNIVYYGLETTPSWRPEDYVDFFEEFVAFADATDDDLLAHSPEETVVAIGALRSPDPDTEYGAIYVSDNPSEVASHLSQGLLAEFYGFDICTVSPYYSAIVHYRDILQSCSVSLTEQGLIASGADALRFLEASRERARAEEAQMRVWRVWSTTIGRPPTIRAAQARASATSRVE